MRVRCRHVGRRSTDQPLKQSMHLQRRSHSNGFSEAHRFPVNKIIRVSCATKCSPPRSVRPRRSRPPNGGSKHGRRHGNFGHRSWHGLCSGRRRHLDRQNRCTRQTGQQQYQNIGCQGSDLPLGGLLGLDAKTSEQCRPNDFSAGFVLLFRLDYNNAFDTGFLRQPANRLRLGFRGHDAGALRQLSRGSSVGRPQRDRHVEQQPPDRRELLELLRRPHRQQIQGHRLRLADRQLLILTIFPKIGPPGLAPGGSICDRAPKGSTIILKQYVTRKRRSLL